MASLQIQLSRNGYVCRKPYSRVIQEAIIWKRNQTCQGAAIILSEHFYMHTLFLYYTIIKIFAYVGKLLVDSLFFPLFSATAQKLDELSNIAPSVVAAAGAHTDIPKHALIGNQIRKVYVLAEHNHSKAPGTHIFWTGCPGGWKSPFIVTVACKSDVTNRRRDLQPDRCTTWGLLQKIRVDMCLSNVKWAVKLPTLMSCPFIIKKHFYSATKK